MLNEVESFRHVHHAGEDLGPILHVEADGLHHGPGAHSRRSLGLWDQCGMDVGWMWDQCGINVGSMWK